MFRCRSILSTLDWTDAQREILQRLNLLTIKPLMYVANVNEEGENPWLSDLKQLAEKKVHQLLRFVRLWRWN